MIDTTVTDFFTKNAESDYLNEYDRSHGPRLDDLVEQLKTLVAVWDGARVLDVGGGLGFLGKRLSPTFSYWVVDGADIAPDQRLCPGRWFQRDLDHEAWGNDIANAAGDKFDIAFCLETLEHIGNPHFALEQIKAATKIGAPIVISVPPYSVTHNCPYPALLWPEANFVQFLGQMALPVVKQWEYKPKTVGWPATHYLCVNRPYSEKTLLFPKHESKFRDCTALQATNL
jgi:SAM-dependent methyltransferase